MLYWAENDTVVDKIPQSRNDFFYKRKSKISQQDYDDITDYINWLIDEKAILDKEKGCYFSIPGFQVKKDWNGTPLQRIYDKMCDEDDLVSALWYGLAYYQVMIDRPEKWLCTKTTFQNRDFEVTVYWRPLE